MPGGYMGKLLWVDLTTGTITEEIPDDKLYIDYIGGYGIGARILYDRMKAGADALGPENILAMIAGPLTGTPALGGARYMAIAKSPLTGGWGDANSGGHFGPYLKFAGYDGVFFTGISPKPVYLFVDNGRAEIKDAAHLWGKSTYETEDTLGAEHGRDSHVICIGPSGEKLSLVAAIITDKGDAAARSGLGAVMGSKKLKAVVVRGTMKVPLADPETANRLRREHTASQKEFIAHFHQTGTGGHGDTSALSGDSPVRNWGGVGVIDTPDVTQLHKDMVVAGVEKRTGCWGCPAACKGLIKAGKEYSYPAGIHRLEYETIGAFGVNCGNVNLESINMANHLCNAYGMDTISGGSIIAFAIECYENGIIDKKDTDGIELTWGNHRALVAMTEKLVKREGFGDILADGVMRAARKIGRGAEKFAVHAGGQELGMHDPRVLGHNFAGMPSAATYWLNSTPGRHTQCIGKNGFITQLNNAMGTCMILFQWKCDRDYNAPVMKAVTGLDRSLEELLKAGERIMNMRHVFNLREGLNPLQHFIHGRTYGSPPLKEGPLAGVTSDIREEAWWHLGTLDWDRVTTKPSRNKLIELGMDDIAEELWPPQKTPAMGH